MVGQPAQVRGISIFNCCGQFHLDRENFAVVAHQHQIYFVVAVACPEVTDGGVGRLRSNPNAKCDQGFDLADIESVI